MEMEREREENLQLSPTPPVISRRLDRLVVYLEDQRSSSGPPQTQSACDEQDKKTLASVLEEVNCKGSLMERLAMMENRVLQLSLEMEEGEGSNSCRILASGNTEDPSPIKHKGELFESTVGKDEKAVKEQQSGECKKRNKSRTHPIIRYRKWLAWIQMGR